MAQFYISTRSNIPNVGASGAIAGVLGAYLHVPERARARAESTTRSMAMPALIVLGMWIALQVFSSVGSIAPTGQTTEQGASRTWPTSAASSRASP